MLYIRYIFRVQPVSQISVPDSSVHTSCLMSWTRIHPKTEHLNRGLDFEQSNLCINLKNIINKYTHVHDARHIHVHTLNEDKRKWNTVKIQEKSVSHVNVDQKIIFLYFLTFPEVVALGKHLKLSSADRSETRDVSRVVISFRVRLLGDHLVQLLVRAPRFVGNIAHENQWPVVKECLS